MHRESWLEGRVQDGRVEECSVEGAGREVDSEAYAWPGEAGYK